MAFRKESIAESDYLLVEAFYHLADLAAEQILNAQAFGNFSILRAKLPCTKTS